MLRSINGNEYEKDVMFITSPAWDALTIELQDIRGESVVVFSYIRYVQSEFKKINHRKMKLANKLTAK